MLRPFPWDDLRARARAAAEAAYAPYSRFRVGAAGLVDDGRIISACNVENASFGITLCAECGLASVLHATGGGRLLAVAIRTDQGDPCPPCGRCRQILLEHGGPDCLVDGDGSPRRVGELLPGAFGPDRLEG